MNEEELRSREAELRKELQEFENERNRIKMVIGRIGGQSYSKKDMILNIVFLGIILALFVMEVTGHFLPAYISLELGVLLVSVKIVWMIHTQQKFNHFQFWVLNTLEFKLNEMSRQLARLEAARESEPSGQRREN